MLGRSDRLSIIGTRAELEHTVNESKLAPAHGDDGNSCTNSELSVLRAALQSPLPVLIAVPLT